MNPQVEPSAKRDFLFSNLQESLRKLDRCQAAALTATVGALLITWKWPWAGEHLKNPTKEVPPGHESLELPGLPSVTSPGVAVLILFAIYFVSGCLAISAARNIRRIAGHDKELLDGVSTYPSLAAHSDRWVRLLPMIVTSLFAIATFLLEARWEGHDFTQDIVFMPLLFVILALPQIFLGQQLWKPLGLRLEGSKETQPDESQ